MSQVTRRMCSKSNILSPFSSAFHFTNEKKKINHILAAKYSTLFIVYGG